MLGFFQFITILVMFLLSYAILRVFSATRTSLFFSREEKLEWDSQIAGVYGDWLVVANVAGTLVSFATVILFFIGNSSTFGLIILIAPASVYLSYLVTNKLTRMMLARPGVRELLDSKGPRIGIVTALFWSPTAEGRRLSSLIRIISMASILAVIWLEFALFAELSRSLLSLDLWAVALIMFVGSTVLIHITLTYGARGVARLDLFHAPMIAVGVVAIFIGTIYVLVFDRRGPVGDLAAVLVPPDVSPLILVMFALHVLLVNSFLIVVTEPHWLRYWMFGDKELTQQKRGLLATALITLLLIVIGFAAVAITGQSGEATVPAFIHRLSEVSFIYPVMFWVAAVSALFSTADAQLYSFLLISRFTPRTGQFRDISLPSFRPWKWSILIGGLYATGYVVVAEAGVRFLNLAFAIVPMSLTLLPAFFAAGGRAAFALPAVAISLVGYVTFTAIGLINESQSHFFNLAAVAIPAVVALVLALLNRGKPQGVPDGIPG